MKRTTKYFGVVELGCNSVNPFYFHTFYKECRIDISIEPYAVNVYNPDLVWEIIDKYAEIHEIAKKAIIEKFCEKDNDVYYFFKHHFDYIPYKEYLDEYLFEKFGVKDFEKIDIKTFVEKMYYPSLDIAFKVSEDNKVDDKITVSLEYFVFNSGSDNDIFLYVFLNEELNVIGFEVKWGFP